MPRQTQRRIRNLSLLTITVLLVWYFNHLAVIAWMQTSRLSGWALMAMILFLASYNLRKKLPGLPLGSSATWLQIHIYVGLLTSFVFALHISWRIPDGILECFLALLYLIVFISGIIGLLLSRSLTKRLTTRGNEVLFERIPVYRKQIALDVESIVLTSLDSANTTAVGEFYTKRLLRFFAGPRNFGQHLMQSNRPRISLLKEMRTLHHVLGEQEVATMRELENRVKLKDDLDYQYTLQATLKYWLFVHVPCTYTLIVFAFLHMIFVLSFTGVMM